MAKNYELGKVGQVVTVNATTNVLTFSTTSAITPPSGNVAQRPASPANGMIRYNTDYNKLENYANGAWANVGSVELVDSITNTSILYAPTANAVNYLNSIKANLSGATFSGILGAAGTLNVSSNAVFTSEVTFDTTGSVKLPVGTTAQRPTGNNGLIRYNSNLGLAEVYSNSYSSWGPLLTAYSDVRQQFTASNNQTIFTVNYLAGAVDVYYNGIKLRNGSEVDVSSGSSVVLANGAANGALVEVVGKGPSYVVSNTAQVVYQQFTASNNQTTFTVSGGYVPGMVDVYVEGIKLVNGTDVNVSSGNNIVLSTGIPNNSLVEVRGVFTPINPQTTAAVRQTFTANSTVNNNFTVTGGYIPGFVDVYYNGAKLVNGSDVNVSSGTAVVLATNAAANAIVDVVGINYYTNAGGVTTPVRQSFTASANQTTFTVTGGYTPGMIDVYQNGVKLVNGADVNVSGGSSVVLATGAANNDTIDVVGFSAVSYQDAVKKSGDTMTGTLNINDRLNVQTSNAIVLTLNSTHPNGGYSTFFTNTVPIFDMGADQHIFGSGNTLNFGMSSRTGYNLSLGSGPNRALVINSSGYVTKPLNPAFLILNNGASQAAGTVVVQYDTKIYDSTSSYSTSTYRFTAPVAGYYFFSAHTLTRSVNQALSLFIRKNGGRMARAYLGAISSAEATATVTAVIALVAGDYVDVESLNGSYNNNYGFFTGYLVG